MKPISIFLQKIALWLSVISLSMAIGACSNVPKRKAPVAVGDYSYLGKYLDWMISDEMGKAKAAGLSIAIVDGQRVVWAKGYGFSDKEKGLPATPDTLYRAGSVSKVLTATEIMRRVERGEIALDAPLATQLPGFSIHSKFPDGKPTTVRSLLAYHSGLPSDRLQGMWTNNPVSLSILQEQLKSDYLAEPPQTRYKYSNLDYSLLGRLIEVRSGQAFTPAIQSTLLQPLGMNRSTFGPATTAAVPIAKPYRGGRAVEATELRDRPAGSLISSVRDLAHFIIFVLSDGKSITGQSLMRADTLNTMFRPQFSKLPLDFNHDNGLGWMIDGVRIPSVGPVVWHDGEYPGYFSYMVIAREKKLGVVVLSNDQASKSFLNKIGEKALELAIETKTGETINQSEASLTKAQSPEFHDEHLDRYTGNYVVFGQLTPITLHKGHLSLEALGKHIDLIPVADDKFVPRLQVLGLINIPMSALSVHFAVVDGRNFAVLDGLPEPFPFERIEPRKIPIAWVNRVGTYQAENSDRNLDFRNLSLQIENGMIVTSTTLSSKLWGIDNYTARGVLIPVSDDEAVMAGIGNGEGETVRAINDHGSMVLIYSGYRFSRDH
jgi:CubicO group peptidase (beta-lactamase class C family)